MQVKIKSTKPKRRNFNERRIQRNKRIGWAGSTTYTGSQDSVDVAKLLGQFDYRPAQKTRYCKNMQTSSATTSDFVPLNKT